MHQSMGHPHFLSFMLQDGSESADPAAALKLVDASAATAAAAEVARAGVALHDGLMAESKLREARAKALAASHDTSMVSGPTSTPRYAAPLLQR